MAPRKKTAKVQPLPEDWHYETAVEAVAAIVERLESGELELGDVFEQFQQAVQSLGQCEQFLQAKQAQVELLIETLED
ncbi:MAG: exodeoxyribonuclease VII small subunit [Synechococcales cyanobacterium RM1_1_8]|nr:exodeoxyribonuclease VII small subunit [Synechococcales cyanobacterium RM1_1_8]